MMQKCYCHSDELFEKCCGPILNGQKKTSSSLALMRSRFSAFTIGNIEHLKKTMSKPFVESKLNPFKWVRLEILGQADLYHVEFKAYYIYRDKLHVLHEQSEFALIEGHWIYTNGISIDTEKETRVVSLNSTCPCGGGKKYKNCHRT